MHDGQSIHDHCLIMIKDFEKFEKLGMSIDKDLWIDLILQSLIDSYGQFIVNIHMNKIQCTIYKLVDMLVTTDRTLKSSRGSVLIVEQITSSKKNSIGKKKKSAKKQKVESKKKKEAVPKKKTVEKEKCFHCITDDH